MGDLGHPETVALAVEMLVSALMARGLSAEAFGGSMVWVAALPGRGRRQAVQCRMDGEGRRLGWFFVWHEPDVKPAWFSLASQADLAADVLEVLLTGRSASRPEAVS